MSSSIVVFKEEGSTPGCSCALLSPLPGVPQGSAALNSAEGASFPSLLFSWRLQALTEQGEDISLRIMLLPTPGIKAEQLLIHRVSEPAWGTQHEANREVWGYLRPTIRSTAGPQSSLVPPEAGTAGNLGCFW